MRKIKSGLLAVFPGQILFGGVWCVGSSVQKIEVTLVHFLGQRKIRVREKVYFHKNNLQVL